MLWSRRWAERVRCKPTRHQSAPTAAFLARACQFHSSRHPVHFQIMFAARQFALNTAPAALARVASRAFTFKTTTIKG
jgi:hypothetical protein